jgi:hypothetical protein
VTDRPDGLHSAAADKDGLQLCEAAAARVLPSALIGLVGLPVMLTTRAVADCTVVPVEAALAAALLAL